MSTRTRRKASGTLKNFVAHSRELRESHAWRALPDNARRVLDRLELEHMQHGGAMNGRLPCTFSDFEKAGLRRKSISLAIRQCIALGFLEIGRRGGRAISGFRVPSLYRLTYLHGRKESSPLTEEWRSIATAEDAARALDAAALEICRHTQPTGKPKKAGGENALTAVAYSPLLEARHPGALAPLLLQGRFRHSYLYLRVRGRARALLRKVRQAR